MEKVVILGASGHAGVIAEAILASGEHDILGLLDDVREAGEQVLGLPILGKLDEIQNIYKREKSLICAVAIGDNFDRKAVEDKVLSVFPSVDFLTVIHPDASVSASAEIGEGSVILAGAVISTGSVLGKGCLLNTNASLDHDSLMGDYSSLAPNVATGGNTVIGEFAAVGIGAILLQGIKVGEHTVIGAGALVTKKIDSYKVAYGSPAVVIRDRVAGEGYL